MLTRSKRRKLDHAAQQAEESLAKLASRKVSTKVFQVGVLVDKIFSFLEDGPRVALRQANRAIRIRSNLPQSWPPYRYFSPSVNIDDPNSVTHLIPQMALHGVILTGAKIGTGSLNVGATVSEKLDAFNALDSVTKHARKTKRHSASFIEMFANSKKTLQYLTIELFPLSKIQIATMPQWAMNVEQLSMDISERTMYRFAQLLSASTLHTQFALPELRDLSIVGKYNPKHLVPLLGALPQLDSLDLQVINRSRVPTNVRRNICRMISKMPLTHLFIQTRMYHDQLFQGETIQLNLKKFCTWPGLKIDALPADLFKCKQLEHLCLTIVPTFTVDQRDQIARELTKLRTIDVLRLTEDDDRSLCLLASIPSVETINCYGSKSVDISTLSKMRGSTKIESEANDSGHRHVLSGGPHKQLALIEHRSSSLPFVPVA